MQSYRAAENIDKKVLKLVIDGQEAVPTVTFVGDVTEEVSDLNTSSAIRVYLSKYLNGFRYVRVYEFVVYIHVCTSKQQNFCLLHHALLVYVYATHSIHQQCDYLMARYAMYVYYHERPRPCIIRLVVCMFLFTYVL